MREIEEYPLGIILKKYINIELKNENGVIGKLFDGKFITNYKCICQEFGKEYIWIMFSHIPKGQYVLDAHTEQEGESDILVIGPLIEEELVKASFKTPMPNRMKYFFKV